MPRQKKNVNETKSGGRVVVPEETFRGRGARPTPLRGALPVRVPVASVLDKGDRGGGLARDANSR